MNDSGADPLPAQAGDESGRQALFVTTHWSVVLSARDKTSPQSAEALERLCRTYWYPLYAHVRRLGINPHEAEDLTQEFFARALRKNYLEAADRERGRFRTFLLMALKRFLADEWDRAQAQKRGGGLPLLPLNTEVAEQRYQAESTELPADRAYEQRWAMAVLQQSLARLHQEFKQAGKEREFERLKRFLTVGQKDVLYADAAGELGQTEGALRVAVHRLRKRFRELFREEVANTVARAEDVDEEFRHLREVLSQ
jgi:RNA polymerase sigma factor (sigma-70 family)